MAKSKLDKTLADYVGIAIGPVLIMLLVGSFGFLLLTILPTGAHAERLRYIVFWFTIAIVLVARVGIEVGENQSRMYGLALAGATSLAMFRFTDRPFLAIPILAAIWYCAHKLTWDCTLIDDDQDASGYGLVQASGLEDAPELQEELDAEEPGTTPLAGEQRPATPPGESVPKWKRKLKAKKSSRPHAPGTWIIWFSLIALPVFGLGPAMVPSSQTDAQDGIFTLLLVFVAAGLSLLVTTSLLALRRYLRQRKMRMPTAMAGAWIGSGAVLVALVVGICLMLPRPTPADSLSGLWDKIAGERAESNSVAVNNSDSGEGDGQRTGAADEDNAQQDPDAEQNDEQQDANERKGQAGENKGAGKSDDKAAEDADSEKQGDQQRADGEQNEDQKNGPNQQEQGDDADQNAGEKTEGSDAEESDESSSDSSSTGNLAETAADWLSWLFKAALVIGGLYLLIRYWRELLSGLMQFIEDLRNLFASLFGRKPQPKVEETTEDEELTLRPVVPFDSCVNPFLAGTPEPATAVVRTFEAVRAWAVEQGFPHVDDLTAAELADRIAEQFFMQDADGTFSENLQIMARTYTAMAYGRRVPGGKVLEPLETLWKQLRRIGGTKRVSAQTVEVTSLRDF